MVNDNTRHVNQLFELTGLDQFVGSTYGAQYKFKKKGQSIIDLYRSERTRLSESMLPREIAVCQGETFHPES